MARRHAEVFLSVLQGNGFAEPIRSRCFRIQLASFASSPIRRP